MLFEALFIALAEQSAAFQLASSSDSKKLKPKGPLKAWGFLPNPLIASSRTL